MLPHQQRLRFAVARLLLQIGFHRRTPIVPYKACRTEPNLAVPGLHAPANIDVIARFAEGRIEHPGFLQRPFVECHVAPGNVFGLAIAQHHMGGASW